MSAKNFVNSLVILAVLAIALLVLIPQTEATINDHPDFRARGYSLTGELKASLLNNGRICKEAVRGYYHGYQNIYDFSLIVGIPGKDPQGNFYPWALRPAVDSLTGVTYPDSIIYWGPTVSESWFDLTLGLRLTDWEADSMSHVRLFGDASSADIPEIKYHWTYPADQFPLTAHSQYPITWPQNSWPGFWGWDEFGQIAPGQFFSDEDIYWEMDDRKANRDVDPTQGYPIGIKVKAQASGFDELPGGLIIYRFRLINQSQWDYKDIYSGFHFSADVLRGWYPTDDDMMRVNIEEDVAYAWDVDNPKTPYVGVGYIVTPLASREIDLDADGQPNILPGDATGATGWHWFDWHHRPGANDASTSGPFSGNGVTPVAKDKEAIQYKLMAGDTSATDADSASHAYNQTHYFHADPNGFLNPRFDSNDALIQNFPEGLDCVFILSNGPFDLNSGDSTEVVVALLSATDYTGLIQTLHTARNIFHHGIQHKKITINNGNGGEAFSGSATITWNIESDYPYPVDVVDVYLGRGYEGQWRLLAKDIPNSGAFTFDANSLEDGVFYKAAIVSHRGEGFVYGISDDFFTINNPGVNVAPELEVLSPQAGDTLSGVISIRWIARDADFDPITADIEISQYNSSKTIAEDIVSKNSYNLDSRILPEGEASIYITVRDFTGKQTSQSVPYLKISNPEFLTPDTIFHHVAGFGNGLLQLHVTDQNALNGNLYQLEFSSGAERTASIYDVTADTYIAQNIQYIDQVRAVNFNGLSLKLVGFDPVIIDSAYWKIGNSTWSVDVMRHQNGNPANYEIIFDPQHPGTVYDYLTQELFDVPFQVFNKTYFPTEPLHLVGIDHQPHGIFSSRDQIFLKEEIVAGKYVSPAKTTFRIEFYWDSTSIPYQSGDIFRFSTLGYFWEQDTILFRSPVWFGQPIVEKYVLYQNYPNPFNNSTNISFALPNRSSIKLEIFNILGQRIRTLLDAERRKGEHKIKWDGRNDSGQSVATGVYIYRMEAKDAFAKSRKMLLLR